MIEFKKYQDESRAFEIRELLEKSGIEAIVEHEGQFNLNQTLLPEGSTDYFVLKINEEDFLKATEALQNTAKDSITEIPKDHYLLEFTDEELYDILLKADEWSEYDVELSKLILKDRGQEISASALKKIGEVRINDLRQHEKVGLLIPLGYVFALLGGFWSIFIGWYVAHHRKRLPNGELFYIYSEEDRKSGLNLLYFSIFIFSIFLVIYAITRS